MYCLLSTLNHFLLSKSKMYKTSAIGYVIERSKIIIILIYVIDHKFIMFKVT